MTEQTNQPPTADPQSADDKQSGDKGSIVRDESGRFAGGTPPAGFNKHPENIGSGRWDARHSISFWYNKFNGMTDAEFQRWRDTTPPEERTQAQKIAYSRVKAAAKSDRLGLDNTKEITDRTEGKAPQVVTQITRQSPLDDLKLSKEELMAIAFGAPLDPPEPETADENTNDEIIEDAVDDQGSQNDGDIPNDPAD